MKALIQKEIIRKPIYPHGEDINGRMESEKNNNTNIWDYSLPKSYRTFVSALIGKVTFSNL